MKHRWIGLVESTPIAAGELEQLARRVLPGIDVSALRPLSGGFRNSSYRVETGAGTRLLQVCPAGDSSVWKQQRLAELVYRDVPTPRYLAIEQAGERVVALREFVPGQVVHELLETPGLERRRFGRLAGATLARIHRFAFDEFGELDAGLGGTLPRDWQELARLTDVLAWVEFASRARVHELILADARERLQSVVRAFEG